MSYNIKDATIDLDTRIFTALDNEDIEGILDIAQELKDSGEDEEAHKLLVTAKRLEKEEWQFDNQKDND